MNATGYRPGAMGALMDEYERAIRELSQVIGGLKQDVFDQVRDSATPDEDCRSIRTVIRHVVNSGYGYVGYLRSALNLDYRRPDFQIDSPADGIRHLAAMTACTASTFDNNWAIPDDVIESATIQSRWGPVFNLEQMFEHAIVHVLRHRRQIERFLTEPRFNQES